jgi:hypothetical protein
MDMDGLQANSMKRLGGWTLPGHRMQWAVHV